ncbi:phosphonate ABC transporter ATP-binding protein [Sneathiella sp. P13V-1]|uniref:phosphonate ABC transporter ATP-binding protein n=1 Tax=Sneathiella sp. P13V-1 TaxID=2697366 RepID=UPI00187B4F04|nr:phosphonate ABC transporter ATP-binding protein [Sneathiella sp. P13V-1]MBE7638642.1 phosphonate ABC transporter ATP-binding protein [Sneathiella sp. P13V-1]
MSAVKVENLSKTFAEGKKALNGVSFNIQEGEMVALIGASGSGKSTLLRHVAGLIKGDRDGGKVTVLDSTMQENGRIAGSARRIRSQVGVVFQQFNLVTRLSVLTNVLMGLLGKVPTWRGTLGLFYKDEKLKAMAALDRMGIAEHAGKRASNLSGGQQQRAAIARALTQGAKLVLADEPIASLDPASSRKVMKSLQRINQEDGISVVLSLHQVDYATEFCPRTIAMRDGRVVFDGPSTQLTPAFLQELYGEESAELFGDNAPSLETLKPTMDEELVMAVG